MSTSTASASGGNDFRLPSTVVPKRYDLTLYPNPTGKSGRFHGVETIDVAVLQSTRTVVLNSCTMKIQSAVISHGNKELNGRVRINEELELATITFADEIEQGDWQLHLRFTGTHKNQLRGFYLSTWEDDKAGTHTIATTQHEATEARKTFPCFDEPTFKAEFKVRLVVDKHLTALSNARMISQTPISRRKKIVEFAPSPKMSTYLTCFIVGELVSSPPALVNGKEMRIWTVPGKEHLTGFALESAARALTWFEEYFGIPYFGGDKIDHVAIPDFEAGAMENPGCVTYRESALLCDPATATHSEMVAIAETDQHETAHFWFGDLVTMKWWNGLWLNESFATFMENLCLSAWKPEWKIWDAFGFTRSVAMRIDGLKSTHPIEMPVNHPDDADELFDAISYNKGGSVLDMIHQFIGFEVFRDGIRLYLQRHAYGNTETTDLWDALEESCRAHGLDVPVRWIMDCWVLTAGHPVVSVEMGEKPGSLNISQQQFLFLNEGQSTSLWPIPLIIKVKDAAGNIDERRLVLSTASATIEIGAGYQWVNVNAGGSGFYRVRYQARLSRMLTSCVQENLSAIERFNLVGDAWACVRAGLVSSPDFLNMIKLFAGEKDPNVVQIIIGACDVLHRLLPKDRRASFKAFVRGLIRSTFDTLGWAPVAGEPVQTTELRSSLFATLGNICADADVLAKAQELFATWLCDKTAVDPNLVGTIVNMLARLGDQARYEQFHQLYKTATTPFEEQAFLFALSEFRSSELCTRTRDMCFTGEVSIQDAPYLYAGLLGNDSVANETWSHLKANWEQIKTVFPTNMIPQIASSCRLLDTPEMAAEVREFFATHEVKAGTMAVAQMLEQLAIALRLRQNETPRLLNRF
jgi:puromycin-sensitive aminopeptidase